MVGISYRKAMEAGLLSDREVKRICAVTLACLDNFKPDYKIAAPEDGSTIGSLGVMWGNMIRKLREKGCEIDGLANSSAPATPSSTRKAIPKKTTGRKRKIEVQNSDEEPDSSPSKKATPKRHKAKVKKESSPLPASVKEFVDASTPFQSSAPYDEDLCKDQIQREMSPQFLMKYEF